MFYFAPAKKKLRKTTEAIASICLILVTALVMRSVFHTAKYEFMVNGGTNLLLHIRTKELQQV